MPGSSLKCFDPTSFIDSQNGFKRLKTAKRNNRGEDSADESESDCKYSDDELQIMVNQCARWVLLQDYQKTVLSVYSITQSIRKHHQIDRALAATIVAKVKEVLEQFGLKIVDTKDKNDYMIVSMFKANEIMADEEDALNAQISLDGDKPDGLESSCDGGEEEEEEEDEEDLKSRLLSRLPRGVEHREYLDECKSALVYIILGYIFLNEDPLNENDLYENLEKIGFNLEENVHQLDKPYNMRKVISDEFCRHHYLKRIRLPATSYTEPREYVYDWGQRAEMEYPRVQVCQFMKRVYQNDDPLLWSRYESRAAKADKSRKTWMYRSDDAQVKPKYIEDCVIGDFEFSQAPGSSIIKPENSSRRRLFFDEDGQDVLFAADRKANEVQVPKVLKAPPAPQNNLPLATARSDTYGRHRVMPVPAHIQRKPAKPGGGRISNPPNVPIDLF